MPTTKRKIAEQVMVFLEGGDHDIVAEIDPRDIMELVSQNINAKLKAEYYGPHIQSGEVSAAGLIIATFEDIAVEEMGEYSKIILPCVPIKLFKNQGLFEMSKSGDILGKYQFIPIPAGMWALLSGMSILSDVLGQICYINEGLNVTFSRNIVKSDEIDKVTAKLIVSDIRTLSEYDPLPVPADMEFGIIADILALYGVKMPSDKTVDISEKQGGGR